MKLARHRSAFVLFVIIIGLTSLAGDELGVPEGTFDLSWFTIDGGGATSSAATYELQGTVGQPDAGTPMTGGSFSLTGGFWPGIDSSEKGLCVADVAPAGGNGIVNVDDLLLIINSWGPCSGCPTDIAPAGGDANVNVDDLLEVINAWGVCG